ncbi:MAG: hypothetical protein AMXMBFR72_29660 [Betaproteobacteria bacterium]
MTAHAHRRGEIPARLTWLAGILDVDPADEILEAGCGNGALAALIHPRLRAGAYVGIDRSPAAIASAARRGIPAAGAVRFVPLALQDADRLGRRFDKIVAMNVNVFWHGAQPELAVVTSLMKARAALYLAYQPPHAGRMAELRARLRANLERAGLHIVREETADMTPAPVLCTIAARHAVRASATGEPRRSRCAT